MEEQTNMLDVGIGTKDPKTLKPAEVEIVKVSIEKVGKDNKNEIVKCEVKHPDSEDKTIIISKVRYEKNQNMTVAGLWVNKDEDGNLSKISPLAVFLNSLKVKTIRELEGKRANTIYEEKDSGFLVFKAY
jgi:hypothetical protein